MNNFEKLLEVFKEKNIPCLTNEPMAKHTTLRIGGPAKIYAMPHSTGEIKEILAACKKNETSYFVLGNGSNLLVADAGFNGVVLALRKNFCTITEHNGVITAQAGAPLSAVCSTALQNGLGGMEFAYGIPATVGGAVYMNAGAYGGEMKDVLQTVTVLTPQGEVKKHTCKAEDFAYRHSCFMAGGQIILEAEFKLHPKDKTEIDALMKDYMARRREKQPLNFPSAGSTFKRPQGAFAAKLIDDCALKGVAVGGAQVSEKHAGFLVNTGTATAEEFMQLINHVKEVVLAQTGYALECEVEYMGTPK